MSEQISAAEDHEVAVWRDLAAAAAGHGLLARAEGAWLALAAPGCPISPFNRVLGIGSRAPAIVDELAEAAAWYAARGIDRYWVQLGSVTRSRHPSSAGSPRMRSRSPTAPCCSPGASLRRRPRARRRSRSGAST